MENEGATAQCGGQDGNGNGHSSEFQDGNGNGNFREINDQE